MSELAIRMALEIAEAEEALRRSAEAYGADADAAVERAKLRAQTTGLTPARAMYLELAEE